MAYAPSFYQANNYRLYKICVQKYTMKNVLIIEPNRLLGRTYVKSLELSGLGAALAVDAQEAIDCADSQAPDVVLMELQLANHNGLEFLHEFRSYAEWRQTPIIINTVIPRQRFNYSGQYLEQLGIKKILYKPTASLQQIIREIRSLL
jgi:CheY-like chemotaxis protein